MHTLKNELALKLSTLLPNQRSTSAVDTEESPHYRHCKSILGGIAVYYTTWRDVLYLITADDVDYPGLNRLYHELDKLVYSLREKTKVFEALNEMSCGSDVVSKTELHEHRNSVYVVIKRLIEQLVQHIG